MTARRRRQRRTSHSRRLVITMQVLGAASVVVATVALAVVVAGAGMVQSWLKDLPDPDKPGAFDVAQATKIYSADGKLLARLYLENREVIPIKKMSPQLVDAVVAIEDERFYTHSGIDPVGIARAAVTNLTAGSAEEGASTITQQYIRNTLLLEERTDITMARKIREAYLAMELEKRYSKDDILEMYLNAVYFGEGAYGAQAAAKTFFNKPANKLTLGEAALLAGLPQQPSRLSPYEAPRRAIIRRNQVLQAMRDNGYITSAQHKKARAEKLRLQRADSPDGGIYAAPYFVAHVKKQLQAQFTPAVVFKGGLTVYTTLDTRLQGFAEDAVRRGLPENGPEGALVSIDPRNGHVKAVVGGRDYQENKFNLATQARRQPGSAFKTFVLVAALERGMPPYYTIDSSSPAYIPTKPEPWVVSNSEGRGQGGMTLQSATWRSVNTVFARVAFALGAKRVGRTANRMGIETEMPPYASIALGTRNVTPLEMASAYGTLATNGVHNKPIVLTKVIDRNNKVLLDANPHGKRVLDPSIAAEATRILEGVITNGTARRAQIGRPAAGKTGTSQDHRDVWFVGYTPQLVTSVWVGHRQERTIIVRGSRAFGGTVCAPIWADFMRNALKDEPELAFADAPKPEYNPSRFRRVPGLRAPKPKPSTEPSITPAPSTKPTQTPTPAPVKPVTPKPTPPQEPKPTDPPNPSGQGAQY